MDRFSQFGLTELGDFLRKAFEHNILDEAIIDSEHAIRMSQRIEKFSVLDDQDQVIYRGTIVGYKKIIPLNGMETTRLRIQIEESRVCPTLSFIGVYC